MALDPTKELQTLTGPEAREALGLVLALPGVAQALTVRGLLRRVKHGRDLLKARATKDAVAAAAQDAARAQVDAAVAQVDTAAAEALAEAQAVDAADYGTD